MGWPIALRPDGKVLVVCDQPGQLRRFDVTTGREIHAPGPPTTPAREMVFTPDGKKLLAASADTVVLHDLNGHAHPLELPLPRKSARTKRKEKPKPDHVAVSRDGKQIAAGWDDGVVCLWDAGTGKLVWQADAHELGVSSLAFAAGDDELVTTGCYDATQCAGGMSPTASAEIPSRRCRQGIVSAAGAGRRRAV